MTPPDDNQPDSKQDNQDFASTVKLMRCNKHGISYYVNEQCPECEKENDPPAKDAASSA